jgi:hypothetical protein
VGAAFVRATLVLLALWIAGCGQEPECRPEAFRCAGAVVQACSGERWVDLKTCPAPQACFIDFVPCSDAMGVSCCR